MKPSASPLSPALHGLTKPTRWLLLVIFCVELLLTQHAILYEETCSFDWDAYMEQAWRMLPLSASATSTQMGLPPQHKNEKLSNSAEPPASASSLLFNSSDPSSPHFALGGRPRQHSGWTFNYSQLEGDTGALVYPAGHAWLHAGLLKLTGWDPVTMTTERPPKRDKKGYEQRVLWPAGSVQAMQHIYQLLHLSMYVAVVVVAVRAGFIRGPLSALLTAGLLLVSRRARAVAVLGFFNDTHAMLWAHVAMLAFTSSRWRLGSALFSLAVSMKMNVLLMAPGLLALYLQAGGYAFAAQQIGICAAVQLLLGFPFLFLGSARAYLGRAFDLSRQFQQVWSVNWQWLPEQVFSSPSFGKSLLMLQVVLLVYLASSLWKPAAGESREEVAPQVERNKAKEQQNALQRVRQSSESGRSEEDRSAVPSSAEDEEGGFGLRAVRDSSSNGSAALSKRLGVASAAALGAAAESRSGDAGGGDRAGSDDQQQEEEQEHDKPVMLLQQLSAARQGMALLPVVKAIVQARPTHQLRAAYIVRTLVTSNFLGVACARSLHFQFLVWYFPSWPLLLHSVAAWLPRIAAWIPLTVMLELFWGVHPPTAGSSAKLTLLHVFMVACTLLSSALHESKLQRSVGAVQLQQQRQRQWQGGARKQGGRVLELGFAGDSLWHSIAGRVVAASLQLEAACNTVLQRFAEKAARALQRSGGKGGPVSLLSTLLQAIASELQESAEVASNEQELALYANGSGGGGGSGTASGSSSGISLSGLKRTAQD